MNSSIDYDTIVVGAGFAGMYMLVRLRELGHNVRVLEKGGGVGGTWYWNRYPGARCDVPSMEYSYQFDEALQQEWNWSERYSAQPEILRYANHVADRYDLWPHVQFDTTVVRADYSDAANQWIVTAEDLSGRKSTQSARYLIAATGCLSSPNQPSISGMDTFKGKVLHTGQWPHHTVDFNDQRVAVIGTGSSGIQAIPVIAEQAARLTVFQRTPNFAVPAHNGPMNPDARNRFKEHYAEIRQLAATRRNGQLAQPNPDSAMAVDEAHRRQQYEQRWQQGGLAFIGSFGDLIVNPESNHTAAEFVRGKINDTVDDPEIARRLSPETMIGCKRLCVDSGYYQTFNRPNVSLIDVRKTPIERVEFDAIRVDGDSIQVDTIVLATGYDAMTGSLLKMNIHGRNGTALQDSWHAGPETYLGVSMHNYPNLFTVTGPGSPSVLTNMLPTIEQHVELITAILGHGQQTGAATIEAESDAQREWVEHVNTVAAGTIYPGCNSWYLGANVPGKPRVFMPYVGFPEYVKKCEQMVNGGFRGFSFS